jgi:hypothetical protein
MSEISELPYAIPWQESLDTAWTEGEPAVVASLLPPGYERYVRLFHPHVAWGSSPCSREPLQVEATWRELADRAGVAFGPTRTVRQLPPQPDDAQDRLALFEGRLEEGVASRLFGVLDDGGDGPWFFAFGLAASIYAGRPLLYRAPSLAGRRAVVDAAQQAAREEGAANVERLTTPEYVWPADRRWIVCTDYDLTSTYLALTDRTAHCLHDAPDLESCEVQLSTRVDSRADEVGSGR